VQAPRPCPVTALAIIAMATTRSRRQSACHRQQAEPRPQRAVAGHVLQIQRKENDGRTAR
jgi:hypothetical protein